MPLNEHQLRDAIRSVLKIMEPEIPYSEDAVELLMLTAAQESHLGTYIRQLGCGVARGIYQMEPDTEEDIWENFLRFRPALFTKVKDYMYPKPEKGVTDLEHNFVYQTMMARIHYYRVPKGIPKFYALRKDTQKLARYWKSYYNTPLGAGTVKEAVKNYRRFCPEGYVSQ